MNLSLIIKKYSVNLFTFLSVLVLAALASCGEDRTYEYEALTQHNIWMYEQMQDKYLWSSRLTEQQWKDYFATPDEYFSKLVSKGINDKWSYIEVDTLSIDKHRRGYFNHHSSYGFDYYLIQDPTGSSTKTYARVVTVFEDSPASRAGLCRNDFIETFDGYKITKNNIARMQNGPSRSLLIHRLIANEDEMVYSWGDSRTVTLSASEYVEDKPFPVIRYIDYEGVTYGYLMCNQLLEKEATASPSPQDYVYQLDQIMASFRSVGVDEFILDLRLCNFGTMEMANLLASYLLPDDCLNGVFVKTIWNEKCSLNNSTVPFCSYLAGNTLALRRVHIITSSYTQGAAEWLINALRHALGSENVILIGQKTAGQNVMTQNIGDYESILHLYPAVAYVADGNEDYTSYASGFTPDIDIDEFAYSSLEEYGTLYETLFNAALHALDAIR